jgi:hypothetical protein
MKTFVLPFLICIGCLNSIIQLNAQQTKVLYLSGTGNDHTVKWQFYCSAGRQSGKWTTIPVPSNWELQGFGTYNYGLDKDSLRGKEAGLYQYKFKIPGDWKDENVTIVFEGSMTDTEVKINRQLAGPVHQGAFYRFTYDITNLIKPGKENLLEVKVAKHSENQSVNNAERHADYWIFGGIYRPVYLEAKPKQHISRVSLNARADGFFEANVYLAKAQSDFELSAQIYSADGSLFGEPFLVKINPGDTIASLKASLSAPRLWSPEFPNLYKVKFTLLANGKPLHIVNQRFGFRTMELRERDGIYVNGVKIKFKGVNRHSFWPASGRTTSKTMSIDDINLMKDMNMNAVRMSHYPTDAHFLDACDSLGLFVLDELAGWHGYYDTQTGTKLAGEMVAFDSNHPSIVMWDNGNEGGHNFDLDPVLDRLDMQERPVIHPWQIFRGTDTQHYRDYDYGNGIHCQGHDVFFPTEFLHGLYDGGAGAGLEDFWELMWNNPLSAGGFLWVFADEGVVRTDKGGQIDNDGSHAPDGILGPYHEKEGSYYTIKEVWSPVHFDHREITPAFDGSLRLQNRYFYTNINQCSFSWKLAKVAGPFNKETSPAFTGTASAPDILPGQFGMISISLPNNWRDFDVLYVTAYDPYKREIFTWTWPISKPDRIAAKIIKEEGGPSVIIDENDTTYNVNANGLQISFNRKNGLLQKIQNTKGIIPFGNGPVLCEGEADFQAMNYRLDNGIIKLTNTYGKKSHLRELTWTIYPSGWVKMDVNYIPTGEESALMGISFSYPERLVKGIRWMGAGPYRVWKNRIKGTTLGVWEKAYNNTVTGESQKLIYPEFKGYYSNFYWLRMETTEQPFTIVCNSEDIFLRLFTPQSPKEAFNVAPAFPGGDISFMQGITPIGTKGQKAENLGPMGKKNMYFDYWKARPKEMTLWFDFSGR